MTDTCCVVDQFCNSPANLWPPVQVKGKCFACGQPVCRNCSSIRKYYHYGNVRLCNNCQIEYDGNDNLVMARIYKMAGYTPKEANKMQKSLGQR